MMRKEGNKSQIHSSFSSTSLSLSHLHSASGAQMSVWIQGRKLLRLCYHARMSTRILWSTTWLQLPSRMERALLLYTWVESLQSFQICYFLAFQKLRSFKYISFSTSSLKCQCLTFDSWISTSFFVPPSLSLAPSLPLFSFLFRGMWLGPWMVPTSGWMSMQSWMDRSQLYRMRPLPWMFSWYMFWTLDMQLWSRLWWNYLWRKIGLLWKDGQ